MAAQDKRSQPSAAGRRFKRRQLKLPEGGSLVLRGDGSIRQTDATGEITGNWGTGDPEWARHAIRFGLQPQAPTVAPHGRGVPEPRTQAG